MHPIEKWCLGLRHSSWMKRASGVWDFLRPGYNRVVSWVAPKGIERTMNGTDSIRLHPQCRHTIEIYEPEVWRNLMQEVRKGDTVADVGANIGLYTMALAQRVGEKGRVFAFEPDPANAALLKKNLALNFSGKKVEVIEAAVGNEEGMISFEAGQEALSRVGHSKGPSQVRSVTLNRLFDTRRLDLLKIDVEGFEEKVLEGALLLLKDPTRKPRKIFMEVHPYAWPSIGSSAESLMRLLSECGYQLIDTNGQPVSRLGSWGEVIAQRKVE